VKLTSSASNSQKNDVPWIPIIAVIVIAAVFAAGFFFLRLPVALGLVLASVAGTLAAGTSATVTVTILPKTGGNLLATAQVTTTSTDPNTFNNRALAATLAFPQVAVGDVSLTKPNVGTTNAVFTLSLPAPSGQTITHYRILDDHYALAFQYIAYWVEFHPDLEIPDELARLYERPADIVAPDHSHIERYSALLCVSDCRRCP
jgi:hypothetical protein